METQPTFLNYKKVIFKKSKNLHFSKNLNFHASLFFYRKHLATLLNNVLETEQPCLNYKNVIFKSGKICIFPKGLTHDFGQKFELSCIYVFLEETPGYTSNNNLETKQACLNYKNVIFKSRKICIFAKGLTHDCGQKFELPCISVSLQKTPGYTFK